MADRDRATGFAERLKRARELAGLSQRELARRAGIADALVSVLENQVEAVKGKTRGTAETVGRLAHVLGVSMDWLWKGVGREPSMRSIRAAVAASPDPAKTGTE